MARIAFIHTVAWLVDEFRKQVAETLPHADAFHMLDESLLQDLLARKPVPGVYRRAVTQIMQAVDAGATRIVMTCSSTSPSVDIARTLTSVPIHKIDDPMAEKAVRTGQTIGLLCTADSTIQPSTALLHAHAQTLGREVRVVPSLVPHALDALTRGDRDRHDELVLRAAQTLGDEADVIVLAQASLARLEPALNKELKAPVLASPPLLMDLLRSVH
ncbi:Asp/Glu/hydantoin racemase [Paraburkholderia sp. Ac-20342]|uniref:aspartate/glutamate racemase family protein n=1 Tax=Paraburkholderia sp. Ac-20342 TaxID=2703889 RepID=UPI001980CD68|nr:aspartate/glutamate racemase family protein [Paraburkholderia sp. Ac-20342]MBN3849325.1 Asp/Glu/hydantoin racemase [Paraburkholderia sp. Ac-20342]